MNHVKLVATAGVGYFPPSVRRRARRSLLGALAVGAEKRREFLRVLGLRLSLLAVVSCDAPLCAQVEVMFEYGGSKEDGDVTNLKGTSGIAARGRPPF